MRQTPNSRVVPWRVQKVAAAVTVLLGTIAATGAAADPALASGWAIQPTPNPTGVSASSMEAVSCLAATSCIGVGDINGISGPVGPLAELWNGTAWTIQPSPQGQSLTGVSCTSATACTAVGPGAYRWNGTGWSIQPTPGEGNDGSILKDVSCTAADSCSAVGYYRTYQQRFVKVFTLAERWNGTAWSIQSTPNPNTFNNVLGGVSCTSATACTAVGSDINAPLAERWNGTAWSIQPNPWPAGSQRVVLSGVSCPTVTDCTAVGYYTNAAGAYAPLAEHWNGTAWTIQTIPIPGGAASTVLEDVTCTRPNACIAVGWSAGGALAEQWDGTAWTIQPTPRGGVLSGVSCTTATACTAVGSYTSDSGAQLTLAERYSG